MISKKTGVLALLLIMVSSWCLADTAAPYTGRLVKTTQVYDAPTDEGTLVGVIGTRAPVDILQVLPDWVKISGNGITGYVQRRRIDDTKVKVANEAATPIYPAVLSGWLGWTAQETPVQDAPNTAAQTLITLKVGARLAFIGVEDGWAKLIYHRRYAYVDTRKLSELQAVYEIAATAASDAPIAAFTSFYRITTDDTNLNRMENISVANRRMAALIIEPQGRFDFNAQVGPYRKSSGYLPANVLIDGQTVLGYGGGTCQVSSTLYNVLMQMPGLQVLQRRPHGPSGAPYLPLHSDAAVGNSALNLRFQNNYSFPIRIDGSAQDGALTIAIYRAD